jgi:cytochrome bd ubiquinol oxidase subunit II
VDGERSSGSVFDMFKLYALLIGIAVLSGYVVLRAGWFHLKATLSLRRLAERVLRLAIPVFMGLAVAACSAAVFIQLRMQSAWIERNTDLVLAVTLFFLVPDALMRSIGSSSDGWPFMALACFTILATVLGHRLWLLRGQLARREFATALEHVSIISGLPPLAVSRTGL